MRSCCKWKTGNFIADGVYNSSVAAIFFNVSADARSFSASSEFNAIGTCVSMPVNPTMAGMLREMPSIPYSPCIMEETGRMDRSLRMMHSQIRLTLMAIP